MKIIYFAIALFFSLSLSIAQNSQTFNFTGGMQTFTVPACITSITVDVRGAQGANSNDKLITNAIGGQGGRVVGVLAVTPGQVYNIFVGGVGNVSGAGGYNGGGNGGTSSAGSSCFGGPAAGGGGASDIRFGGVALANRIVVAGGGGGSGRDYCNGTCQPCGCGGSGGSGGLLTGVNGYAANNCGFSYPGTNINGAQGGSQVAGGNGGVGDGGGPSGTAGTIGTGGNGAGGTYDVAGGGGGGGYYGGGGGGGASSGSGVGGGGGGGGSSFLGTLTSAVTTPSIQLGNGVVTISYLATASVGVVASNTSVCAGTPVTLTANGTLTYTWNTGSNANSIVVTPTANTTYTATGSNGTSCTASTTILISITAPPVIPATNPSVCLGSSINLTSSGGSVYSWSGPLGFTSSLQNPTLINSTNAMSGAYTVTVTTPAGCSNTAVSNVTVINTPTANLVSNSPVCVGSNLTFTASGGTINLTGPNGFASTATNPTLTNVSTLANGVYTLLVSAGVCTANTTQAVVVNTSPTPVITSNSPVCINKPINFTGNGGVSYNWSGPGGFTSSAQNPTILSASATNAGTYTLVVTGSNGCTSFSTTAVTINALPTIAPLTNPTVCLNTSINLTSNGGVSYSWSGPSGFTSALQNPSILNASLAMSGAYSVIVTSAAGCTNSAISNVTVLPLPTPAITSNTPCVGSVLNLGASGGATYAWNGPNGFTSTLQNPNISNVSNLASGTYSLVASVGTCSALATGVVTINALPVVVAANSGPACETNSVQLTGNGGVTYQWIGPNGFNSASQNPAINSVVLSNAGVYTLVVTNTNNCTSSNTTAVIVNSNPIVNAIGASVCFGSPATLFANGGSTYSWSGPNAYSSSVANANVPIANSTSSGIYTVTVTNAGGCIASSTVMLSTNPIPTAFISGATSACIKGSVNLQGSGGVSYNWSGPAGFSSSSQNITLALTSAAAGGNYTLTVTNNGGCSNSTMVPVTVNPLPIASLKSDGKNSCIPFCANFSLETEMGSSAVASTMWQVGLESFATTQFNYCFNKLGDYTVNAVYTDGNGCSNTSTYVITAYAPPSANFESNPTKPVEGLDAVNFVNTSHGADITTWDWFFINNNGYYSNEKNPSYLFEKSGSYPVSMVVTNKWGCKDTIIKLINVYEEFGLYIPNSFTPNGDGVNDVFLPKGKAIEKYHLTIFNRWGQLVFESKEFEKGWDGKFNGVDCSSDVYVWKMNVYNEIIKHKEYTGQISIIR